MLTSNLPVLLGVWVYVEIFLCCRSWVEEWKTVLSSVSNKTATREHIRSFSSDWNSKYLLFSILSVFQVNFLHNVIVARWLARNLTKKNRLLDSGEKKLTTREEINVLTVELSERHTFRCEASVWIIYLDCNFFIWVITAQTVSVEEAQLIQRKVAAENTQVKNSEISRHTK